MFIFIKDVILHAAYLIYLKLKALMKKYGWKRLVVFLLVSFLLNLVLICGGWNFLQLMSGLIIRGIHEWFDSQVIEITYPELIFGRNIPHPLTLGKGPPFYLTTFYRYNKEDVVFTCEYNVFSARKAFPIYKNANWRKNGVPVIVNERIYVNISIQLLAKVDQLEYYSVKSTLTIEMIEETDFGGYTCVYYNPMHTLVTPGPSMWEDFNKKNTQPSDKLHDPKCQCNPPKKIKQPENCPLSRQKQQGQRGALKEQTLDCFTEFRLEKINKGIISNALNPGSIFITSAHYITNTDIEDLEYDVTFPSDKSCCSKLVWLYWYWFRDGFFQRPPFTRTRIDGKVKYFYRYQCMCPSSYGTKEFTLSRNYFNLTTRSYDRADIVFPFKLRLVPTLSHPWSSRNGSDILNLVDPSLSCWDSDFTTESNINTVCAVISLLLESAFENLIFYEEWIFNVSIFIILMCVSFIPLYLNRCCSRPILSACLTYGRRETTLAAVKGEPITYTGTCVGRNTDIHPDKFRYQVYISYEENNQFDLMIAQHIKGLLLTLNLSVFDCNSDVLPGMPVLEAIGKAIDSSYRFVVIASKHYLEDEVKVMEFDSIQRAILSQNCKLKDRLIIIQSEIFEIQRIYRVPHILIHEVARGVDAMDDLSLTHFLKWETATRPSNVSVKPDDFYNNVRQIINRKLALAIGIALCFLVINGIGIRPYFFSNEQ
ncbi:unnamed protein product [Lymnaea stagnalis]|uniref:TIR domain-containing protein n=1 Tax=Lymnaea stagnalis TaxID=6523 RepID=A0AAV2H5M5_LYMST